MEKTHVAYLSMIFVSAIWGLGYTAIKICLEAMTPITLGVSRFFFSLVFFIPLTIKLWTPVGKKDLIIFLFLGLTGVTFYQIFYNTGALGISPGIASILISTEPIFIYVLSLIFLSEKYTMIRFLGLIISFLGIVVIFIENLDGANSFLYLILILLASIVWSIYTVLSKFVLNRYNPLFVTSFSSITGTIFLIPFISPLPTVILHLNLLESFSLLFLVIFATFIAFYLYFRSVRYLPASKVAVFLYLAPVFTVISAYILLHEPLTTTMIIGGIMVIGGVALVNK